MTLPGGRHRHARLQDLLAVPFALIRVPLYALDRQVVQRLDQHAAARTVFDCGLGTIDILAGHMLGDEGITRYGRGRVRNAMQYRPSALAVTSSTEGSDDPGLVRRDDGLYAVAELEYVQDP